MLGSELPSGGLVFLLFRLTRKLYYFCFLVATLTTDLFQSLVINSFLLTSFTACLWFYLVITWCSLLVSKPALGDLVFFFLFRVLKFFHFVFPVACNTSRQMICRIFYWLICFSDSMYYSSEGSGICQWIHPFAWNGIFIKQRCWSLGYAWQWYRQGTCAFSKWLIMRLQRHACCRFIIDEEM